MKIKLFLYKIKIIKFNKSLIKISYNIVNLLKIWNNILINVIFLIRLKNLNLIIR